MSFEIEKATLGDFLTFKNGRKSPERSENANFPVFGSNGLIGRSESVNCPENTIIIGRVGSYCGSVHFSKEECWVSDNAISCSLKNAEEEHFWFYFLTKLNLNQFSSGSGQPLLNQATLNAVECEVPHNASTRVLIGNVLHDYDKKIKLNSKTNQTLEEMAQAIFKSWFVDFDPVQAKMRGEQPEGMDTATAALFPDKLVESELGLIPEGWEVKPLDKIAEFQNGLALQKFRPESDEDEFLPVLKIAQLRQGYCDGKERARADIKESCRVYDGDVIFSWSGSLMVDLWTGGNAALNQHLFKVTSKEYSLPMYLYWTKHHLASFQQIAKDKAVTMGHIKRSHLSESMCLIPPKGLQSKFDKILLPLIEQCINLRLQSNKLSELRDTLLPKLLSGEVTLAELEVQGE